MRVSASRRGAIVVATLLACALVAPAQQAKKDYLSGIEADKIRDAESSSERIKLFLSFATDRIKKFQYELARPAPGGRHGEMLNSLLNAYAGCVDDAAELISLGHEKGEDIRAGVKDMQAKAKEFLAYLEGAAAKHSEHNTYKATLDDAIEATKDALHEAEEAAKENPQGPVRRKP